MHIISTDDAPKPVGPYSSGVEADGFVFTAGQVGRDPVSGELAQGLEAQARQALMNTEAVLKAAGLTFHDVVKVTIYVTDIGQFSKINEIYGRALGDARPARSVIGVAALPLGSAIEIDAIAARGTPA